MTSRKYELKEHKKSKHDRIRYSCDQCEYAATKPSPLKTHMESKHEGVRYPCDQCENPNINNLYMKELNVLATNASLQQLSLVILNSIKNPRMQESDTPVTNASLLLLGLVY